LRVRRWLKKITELVVKNKNATVVWVLETLFSNVRVNRAGNEATGDELIGFDSEKLSELWRDGLFAVEAVVLRTGSSFGSVWVVLLGLDLTNDLGQGLDVVAEGGNFGEDSFKRHLVMSYLGITSLSLLLRVLTTQQQLVIS